MRGQRMVLAETFAGNKLGHTRQRGVDETIEMSADRIDAGGRRNREIPAKVR
jgi:hypothetical protein